MWSIIVGIGAVIISIMFLSTFLDAQLIFILVFYGICYVLYLALSHFWYRWRRVRRDRFIEAIITSEIVNNPQVQQFYQNTKEAWSIGKLDQIDSIHCRVYGDATINALIYAHIPVTGGALHALFSQYLPKPDEFLVKQGSQGNLPLPRPELYVLTNKRLVIKEGKNMQFREVDLKNIDHYDLNTSNSTLSIKMISGDTIIINKAKHAPPNQVIDACIRISSENI